MSLLNHSMFSVALPAIRAAFDLQPDMVAWSVIALTLPYFMFMPLCGRLGDVMRKPPLLLAGMAVFTLGTVLATVTQSLVLLMIARVIQGTGAASFNPLGMAIISESFPPEEKGKALGTWQSMAPMAQIIGPVSAGFMIDHLGWRTIFVPIIVIGLIGLVIVALGTRGHGQRQTVDLRFFDWTGVALLSWSAVLFIFFVSSRPITGRAPLTDLRLIVPSIVLFVLFLFHEKRHQSPLISLSLFRIRNFRIAFTCTGLRMFSIIGLGFLSPLYLADIKELSATVIGFSFLIHAAALLATTRLGGRVADLWGSRLPVVLGAGGQCSSMVCLALLPGEASLVWYACILIMHGLSAGLSLAALHRAALNRVPAQQIGVAAGLYSMGRFGVGMLGSALGGVILKIVLDRGFAAIQAYQSVFWFIAILCVVNALVGARLKQDKHETAEAH
jgi:EmrB/QacA subfamily drug resistance transporter